MDLGRYVDDKVTRYSGFLFFLGYISVVGGLGLEVEQGGYGLAVDMDDDARSRLEPDAENRQGARTVLGAQFDYGETSERR